MPAATQETNISYRPDPLAPVSLPDSPYALMRLAFALALMTVGSGAMYIVPVVLPAVQADFGVARADASLPYTLLLIGFAFGGIMMGRLTDRFGIMLPLLIGGVALGIGFSLASFASNIMLFALAHGLIIGLFGCSANFAPLIADTSLWFIKRRGIAVAVCASGNYLGGVVWPPILQHGIDSVGWRQTYLSVGIASALIVVTLALFMRRRPPTPAPASTNVNDLNSQSRPFGMSPGKAQTLLCVAGLSCCVAMAMPQVHIVAYCGDLGYGAARGAQMLSLMLAFGIASRLISGVICDRIGGLRTLLLGAVLQGTALLLFLPFDGLVSLYVISALFGLFQGGIVPAYAIIVREHFPASQAGSRVGIVMLFTLGGMALGGWMSGLIFDLTGSYQAAFLNGLAFNAVTIGIVLSLLLRVKRRQTGGASLQPAL